MWLASRDQTRGRDRASDTFLSLELMPPSEGDEICKTCGHGFKPRGIASHEKACKSKAATMKQDSTFAANLKAQRRTNLTVTLSPVYTQIIFNVYQGTLPIPVS